MIQEPVLLPNLPNHCSLSFTTQENKHSCKLLTLGNLSITDLPYMIVAVRLLHFICLVFHQKKCLKRALSLLLPGDIYRCAWFGKMDFYIIRTFFNSATTLSDLLLLHAWVWDDRIICWHLAIIKWSGWFLVCSFWKASCRSSPVGFCKQVVIFSTFCWLRSCSVSLMIYSLILSKLFSGI